VSSVPISALQAEKQNDGTVRQANPLKHATTAAAAAAAAATEADNAKAEAGAALATASASGEWTDEVSSVPISAVLKPSAPAAPKITAASSRALVSAPAAPERKTFGPTVASGSNRGSWL
jgi:hypothetical protein